eukprot:1159625-Pelagomonas_calceolata.AAC.10
MFACICFLDTYWEHGHAVENVFTVGSVGRLSNFLCMESSSMYILAVKPHAARRKSQATCPPAHLQGLRVLAVSGAQGVTASITMHAPDTKQQSHNHPINVSNCVAMLLKIFNNVLEHPEEQKFRQVWLLRPSTCLAGPCQCISSQFQHFYASLPPFPPAPAPHPPAIATLGVSNLVHARSCVPDKYAHAACMLALTCRCLSLLCPRLEQ